MELIDIFHDPKETAEAFKPHVFIAASGYESRSVAIPEQFAGLECKKIALCFAEKKREMQRKENDRFFRENKYQMLLLSVSDAPPYEKLFSDLIQEELRIVIDISVMTKYWYYALFKYIYGLRGVKRLFVRVVYSQAKFTEPPIARTRQLKLQENTIVEATRMKKSTKETALILGLGNEKNVGMSIYKKLNPVRTVLLYADPSMEKDYVESVLVNNHELLSHVEVRDLQSYPVNDTKAIYTVLISNILPLRGEYKVVIVPQGPKIFSVVAMILQLSYPDVTLYFPRFKRHKISDRVAVDKVNILDLEFGID